MAQKRVIVKQTRSAIRADQTQRATLRALGLGKIGRTVEQRLDDSLIGMIRKVSHLVEVRELQ